MHNFFQFFIISLLAVALSQQQEQSPSYDCEGIIASDSWCNANCNHIPRFCPDTHCKCILASSTTISLNDTSSNSTNSENDQSGNNSTSTEEEGSETMNSDETLQCQAISPSATNEWCQANCNHIPKYCPETLCECNGASNNSSDEDDQSFNEDNDSNNEQDISGGDNTNSNQEDSNSGEEDSSDDQDENDNNSSDDDSNSSNNDNENDSQDDNQDEDSNDNMDYDGQFIGNYIKTWAAWSYQAIRDLFKLSTQDHIVQINYLSFAQPVEEGIRFTNQSPEAQIWCSGTLCPPYGKNIEGFEIYKEVITEMKQKGIKTLISIGGWTYRDDFKFLASKSQCIFIYQFYHKLKQNYYYLVQLIEWAKKVKQMVDKINASGIDIDFEAQTKAEWDEIFVEKKLIQILKDVFTADDEEEDEYLVVFTIPALSLITVSDYQHKFDPALKTSYANSGMAYDSVKENWNSIDFINLMTYDGEPNLHPNTCLLLSYESLKNDFQDGTEIKQKLFAGFELGSQFGDCKGSSQGWCYMDTNDVVDVSNFVKYHNYKGVFYWSNVDYENTQELIKQADQIFN